MTNDLYGEGPVPIKCPDTIHGHLLNGFVDKNASLRVYRHNLHCFGCGYHTDRRKKWGALALLLGLWDGTGDDYQGAMQARAVGDKYLYGSNPNPINPRPIKPLLDGQVLAMQRYMWYNLRNRVETELISKRGISEETIRDAGIGHDGFRWSIPVYDWEGKLVSIRYRRDDYYGRCDEDHTEYPKYEGTFGYNKPLLYPMDKFNRGGTHVETSKDRATIYVTEGELDTLCLRSSGRRSITITNGAGQLQRIPDLLNGSGHFRGIDIQLILFTDQDERGLKGRADLDLAARKYGIECIDAYWPDECKDACELFGKYGESAMERVYYVKRRSELEREVA